MPVHVLVGGGRTARGSVAVAASGSSAKSPAFSTDAHRRGVLGEEDVGGGGLALLDDLVGHLEVVAAAQLTSTPVSS